MEILIGCGVALTLITIIFFASVKIKHNKQEKEKVKKS